MKTYLVIMFLMTNGAWVPGDIVAPDGWSRIAYDSLEQCLERKEAFTRNMAKTEYKDKIKAICTDTDPSNPFI